MTDPARDSSLTGTMRHNVDLKPYNTLGVAAKAATFMEIRDEAELTQLAESRFFRERSPIVLGGGSNVLLKRDPAQPVLKISIPGISVISETEYSVMVEAGAGVNWHELVTRAVEEGYGGIENLALIPGTVGAAPIQNIGAYGVELADLFHSLTTFIIKEGAFKTFYSDDCRFGYRDSIFKRDLKGEAIITRVALKLQKAPHRLITGYYALSNRLEELGIDQPGISDIYEAVVAIRRSKLPDPASIGNAGSFFKNPVIPESEFKPLENRFPDVPSFPAGEGMVKVPAGWLIEQAGWKGKRVGNVGTYMNQALVIVNHGGATGAEIYEHAMRIQKSVKETFGIMLVPEVNILE